MATATRSSNARERRGIARRFEVMRYQPQRQMRIGITTYL
jgi:hypothetical protein